MENEKEKRKKFKKLKKNMPYISVDDVKTKGEQDIITVFKKLTVKMRKQYIYIYISPTYI